MLVKLCADECSTYWHVTRTGHWVFLVKRIQEGSVMRPVPTVCRVCSCLSDCVFVRFCKRCADQDPHITSTSKPQANDFTLRGIRKGTLERNWILLVLSRHVVITIVKRDAVCKQAFPDIPMH